MDVDTDSQNEIFVRKLTTYPYLVRFDDIIPKIPLNNFYKIKFDLVYPDPLIALINELELYLCLDMHDISKTVDKFMIIWREIEEIEYLKTKNIPAMIYYPVPLHRQKAYLDPRYKDGHFPVAEHLSKNVFSLPMHTELDEEQLNHITSSILEFIDNK